MNFKPIKSGFSSLDNLLDNIRLGDNVVMQVNDLTDFKKMALAFTKQAILDNRNINYIRFAQHPPILDVQTGLKIHTLNPTLGFETFTIAVHDIIEREGFDAFYVFDCLSDLQVAWSTDLMMGNFFCVTCPFLFELNTVAYFPVIRGHHDYSTIARIQETTQLLINIYSNSTELYIHPLKVWNRYSADMFLPHKLDSNNDFIPLTNSVDLADYYNLIHLEQESHAEQNIDSYERFFKQAKKSFQEDSLTQNTIMKITKSMMTTNKKMSTMISNNLSPNDFFNIKERIIGTGAIGGKSCGMLLARKIIEKHLPQYSNYIEPHDSFYIGSDVFYFFIVENKLWKIHIAQKKKENYFTIAKKLSAAILKGKFPQSIQNQFKRMLEYFGQIPIIVRSSSFLEDNFGSAFAGKYESVFCANGFSPEERLEAFENAVRIVYASTLSQSALEYRQKRGMDKSDEQMAILVQRVSGTKFDNIFMPCAAGVGFSYSLYRWSNDLSAEAGLLRLVAGLGTKAVERTDKDYPRLVNLDRPEQTNLIQEKDKHTYSQKTFDVINIAKNLFEEFDAKELLTQLPKWYSDIVFEHDYEAERYLSDNGQYQAVQFLSCLGVVQNKLLIEILKNILQTLQTHYQTPVDIEYTINFNPEGKFVINLLQCRPLTVWETATSQKIPDIPNQKKLFEVSNTFMGNTAKIDIDIIVYIDAKKYYELKYSKKATLANIIGTINRHYKNSQKNLLLITPGRIGTTSPELGIPVTFSDISNFRIIVEYTDAEVGFVPELSFGSHMFQDLVESNIFYIAIMDTTNQKNTIFNQTFLKNKNSIIKNIIPNLELPDDIIMVYEISKNSLLTLYADFQNRITACGEFSSK